MADRSNLFDVPSSEKQSGLLKPTPDLVSKVHVIMSYEQISLLYLDGKKSDVLFNLFTNKLPN